MNSGEAYETKNKKEEIVTKAKKILEPPCGETCRKKCSDAFSEEDRKQIFEEFWNLADIDLQRAFIIAHVSVADKKRTRVRNTCKTARRKKELTRAYYLNNAATKTLIPVCQKFFLNMLAVDEKRVRTALAKRKQRLEQSKLILVGSTIIMLILRRGRRMSWTTCNFLKLLNHIM